MRLGISTASFLSVAKQGEGVYLEQLLTGLQKIDSANQYFVFMPAQHQSIFQTAASNVHVIEISNLVRYPILSVLWYLFVYPFLLAKYRIDVVHLPEIRRIPLFKVCPTVLTVADLTNFRIRGKAGTLRLVYNSLLCRFLLSSADAICVHAENTKRDLQDIWRVSPDRISVIPHGIDSRFRTRQWNQISMFRAKYSIDDPAIVCVSRLEHPLKNHTVLLRAFARLKERGLQHCLLLVGQRAKGHEIVEREIRQLGLTKAVRIFGFVPEEDLPYFYNVAQLSVFPSLYEGFGYPVLESFASGVPLVASRSSSITEVAGNAALLFQPQDDAELAEKMWTVLQDVALQKTLIQSGFERVAQFSVEEEARRTLELYQSTYSNSRKLPRESPGKETSDVKLPDRLS